jgi:predicted enzyme related to lactoylglutathione lyase
MYRREGQVLFEGTVLEVEAPHRLVTTFSPLFLAQASHERPSRMTWRIDQIDQDVRLTVAYDEIDEGSAMEALVKDGLAYPLHTLKAILETGRRPPVRNVTFDCADPRRLASFWAEVTGFVWDGATDDWAGLHDRRGIGPRLLFMRVPESKTVKNRVHLDVSAADREAEAERLTALGGRRLRTVTDQGRGWIVMADPEGNEFCIA